MFLQTHFAITNIQFANKNKLMLCLTIFVMIIYKYKNHLNYLSLENIQLYLFSLYTNIQTTSTIGFLSWLRICHFWRWFAKRFNFIVHVCHLALDSFQIGQKFLQFYVRRIYFSVLQLLINIECLGFKLLYPFLQMLFVF